MIPDKIYVADAMRTGSRLFGLWTDKDHRDTPYCQYIRKEALLDWVKKEMERLWELLPDSDNDNPTQMELRYLGQYMQMESLEDKLNSM